MYRESVHMQAQQVGTAVAAMIRADGGIICGANAIVACTKLSGNMAVPIIEMDVQCPCRITGKGTDDQQRSENAYHGAYDIGWCPHHVKFHRRGGTSEGEEEVENECAHEFFPARDDIFPR